MSLQKELEEADGLIAELEQIVPQEVALKLQAEPTPFPLRLGLASGGHLHRVLDLAEAALALVRDQKPLPAIVLARACLESAAVLAELADRAERFVSDRDQASFNDFLEDVALGSRNDDTPFEATNVLTFIDKLEQKMKGVRAFYTDLCEQAHPNWAATAPYINTGDGGQPVFLSPGEDFARMVPAPILLALKISTDAGQRIDVVGKEIRNDA